MKQVKILAIESSCDETSASVLQDGKILSNIIASQTIHEKYGGVVPELASRAHQQHIVPVVQQALEEAGVSKETLNAIAFTQGPGLIGALLVGSSFAKSFAQALGLPLIAVNHMQAHILSHFIDDPKPRFPFLCLTVSGGHTQIVLVKDHLDMELIGQTLDDAAGEAFDKAAKMLGLSYPGGPVLDRLAQKGDPHKFQFPEPRIPGFDYSFSGLKTSFLYFIRDKKNIDPEFIENNLADICASIQHRIVTVLLSKFSAAAEKLNIKHLAIAGGVSANSYLRKELEKKGNEKGYEIFIPQFQYCTDNAAMIAMAGYYKYLKNDFAGLDVLPRARM